MRQPWSCHLCQSLGVQFLLLSALPVPRLSSSNGSSSSLPKGCPCHSLPIQRIAPVPRPLGGKVKFCLRSWKMLSFAQTCACPVPTQAATLRKPLAQICPPGFDFHHSSSCPVWTLWVMWGIHSPGPKDLPSTRCPL